MVTEFVPAANREGPLAGFANIDVDDVQHDVLVFEAGLLVVADPDRSGPGKPRLERLLRSAPVADLVRQHRFIRYDEMVRARVLKRTPLRVELELAGGQEVRIAAGWTTPLLTKESDRVLADLLTTRVPRPATRPTTAVPVARGLSRAERVRAGLCLDGSVVLDALANVKVNGTVHDLVMLDVGFVLIADPGPAEAGRDRLTRLVGTASAYDIAARNWLVRHEEIVEARITKDIPLRAELVLWGGERLSIHEPWTTQDLTDDARTTLTEALWSVGARPVR